MARPTRLRFVSHTVLSATDFDMEDAVTCSYMLLSLPQDSAYFAWRRGDEHAFAQVVSVNSTRERGLADVTLSVEQANRTRQFVIAVPLAILQAAHMFATSQETEVLFFIQGEHEKFEPERIHPIGTFDFHVQAPKPGEQLNDDIVTVISSAQVGHPILHLSASDRNNTRGDLMVLLYDLVSGKQAALETALAFVEPMNALIKRMDTKNFSPSAEERRLMLLRFLLIGLLEHTHPTNYSDPDMPTEEVMLNHAKRIEFDEIVNNGGLEELFTELEADLTGNFARPTPDASADIKLAYLASPISQLPTALDHLRSSLTRMAGLDKNWNGRTPQAAGSLVENGDDFAAALVAVAIRVIRIGELVEDPELNFHPSRILYEGLNMPDESIDWAFEQTFRFLARDNDAPFKDFIRSTTPLEIEVDPIHTGLGYAIHQLGQLLLGSTLPLPIFRSAFKDLPIMLAYATDLFTIFGLPHQAEEICVPHEAMNNLLRLDVNRDDLLRQLGQAYLLMAQKQALGQTEFQPGTAEWQRYIEDYLVEVAP